MENIKPNSCRICLKSETFGANFENLNETVYKGGKSALTAMKEVLGIKISQEEIQKNNNLPGKICEKCSKMLEISLELYSTAMQTQKIVQEFLLSKANLETAQPDANGLFPCDKCIVSFISRARLKKHMHRVHVLNQRESDCSDESEAEAPEHEEEFICDVCSRKYDSHLQLKEHIKRNHGFKCNYCLGSYKYAERLSRHLQRRHRDDFLFDQIVVNGVTVYTDENRTSKYVPIKEEPSDKELQNAAPSEEKDEEEHQSDVDMEEQSSIEEDQSDIEEEQNPSDDEESESEDCSETEKTWKDVEKYMKTAKENSSNRYECPECTVTFSEKYNLKRHLCRHYEVLPFHCTTCDKGFAFKYELKDHEKEHQEEHEDMPIEKPKKVVKKSEKCKDAPNEKPKKSTKKSEPFKLAKFKFKIAPPNKSLAKKVQQKSSKKRSAKKK